MFTKRIIPCLDCKDGRVVKGTNFVDLRDAGDPVEVASMYDKSGADELVFLDITASSDGRNTTVDLVRRVAERVFIPFTVGGGIRSTDDFKVLLREGADKISINSAAIMNPQLISDAADKFGSQCVVVAIDAKTLSNLEAVPYCKCNAFQNCLCHILTLSIHCHSCKCASCKFVIMR